MGAEMSASPFLGVIILVAVLLWGLPLLLWRLADLFGWGIFAAEDTKGTKSSPSADNPRSVTPGTP